MFVSNNVSARLTGKERMRVLLLLIVGICSGILGFQQSAIFWSQERNTILHRVCHSNLVTH